MNRNHRYKVILIEDGSTIVGGFTNALTAAGIMRNNKDYRWLSRKEWKVVRDTEAELQDASRKAVEQVTRAL